MRQAATQSAVLTPVCFVAKAGALGRQGYVDGAAFSQRAGGSLGQGLARRAKHFASRTLELEESRIISFEAANNGGLVTSGIDRIDAKAAGKVASEIRPVQAQAPAICQI